MLCFNQRLAAVQKRKEPSGRLQWETVWKKKSFLAVLVFLLFQYGGGGFFLACEDLGRMFDYSFPAYPPPPFFFKVEVSSRTLILRFMPGSVQSGSAN